MARAPHNPVKPIPFNAQAAHKAAPREGEIQTEYPIESVRGLYLLTSDGGAASWRFKYQVKEGGVRKFRVINLGRRPTSLTHIDGVTLHDARTRAAELMAMVEAGGDPKRDIEGKANGMTFAQLAEDRVSRDVKLAESTKALHRFLLRKHINPAIGHYLVDEIKRPMIAKLLRDLQGDDADAPAMTVQVDKIKSLISAVYRYGMDKSLASANPAAGFKLQADHSPRFAKISEKDLRTLWLGLSDPSTAVPYRTKMALKLLLLTGVRRAEMAGAKRDELSLDGDNPTWTIPGNVKVSGRVVRGRVKNGQENVVLLSTQAAALFREVMRWSKDPVHVFGGNDWSEGKSVPHMTAENLTQAHIKIRNALGLKGVRVHDFRHFAATWMGEAMVRPDVIKKVLNHQPPQKDITSRVYNHATLAGPVRAALQAWADHVEAVAAGAKAAGNVVAFGMSTATARAG